MVLSLQLRALISGLLVVNQKLIREDVKNIPMGEPLVLKGIGFLTIFIVFRGGPDYLSFVYVLSKPKST